MHRAKLVQKQPRTTIAPTRRPMRSQVPPPVSNAPKRRLRINTRPTEKSVATEVDDLSNDKFFFDELSKNQPPSKKETVDDVEVYHRPNVDKGIVFVQQNNGKGKSLSPGPTKQMSEPDDIEYEQVDGSDAALAGDTVVPGDEETPEKDVEAIEPDVFVENGHDEDIGILENGDNSDDASESDEDYEELNADFEIVDEDNDNDAEANDARNAHETHEIIEFRSAKPTRSRTENRHKQQRPQKKIRGKHYVRQFQTPHQFLMEIDKIIHDDVSSRNEKEDDDNNYWEVRIEKPHISRGKT